MVADHREGAPCWLSLSGQRPRLTDHRPERQRLRAQELVVGAGDEVGLVKLANRRPQLGRGGLAQPPAIFGVVLGDGQASHLLDELL